MRKDNRQLNELRKVKITPHPLDYPEGSALIEMGNTRVLCAATLEESVPRWLQGKGSGWVTAEYSMLPRSTHTRIRRDKGTNSGRSMEISRLIARSLRASTDLKKLGERSITVDCDVIQADGGTRTAAITGGFVALAFAIHKVLKEGLLKETPLLDSIAAVSVGLKENQALLDLNYEEDVSIETDTNFVVTGSGTFVEIQGTAESTPFTKANLDQMTEYALKGCQELKAAQKEILGDIFTF